MDITGEIHCVMELLVDAAMQRDEAKLDKLLKAHGKEILNCPVEKESGKTALHLLTKKKSVEGIELLLKKGADVLVEDKFGFTALHSISDDSNYLPGAVEALLKFGDKRAQILKMNEMYMTTQYRKSCWHKGQSPLHDASMNDRNLPILEELLRALKGASTDSDYLQALSLPDHNEGDTPLHCAIRGSAINCAQLLLGCGASPRASNKSNATPFYLATIISDGQLLGRIFQNHDITDIIDKPESVSRRDQLQFGYSENMCVPALHRAAFEGTVEVVNWLLQRNASIDLVDEETGDESLARFIQEHSSTGAVYDAVNARGERLGRTALHWATILRQRDIVATLCRSTNFKDRLTATVEDKQQKTALQYALARMSRSSGAVKRMIMRSAASTDHELNIDKDIEKELMMRDDVKGQIEALYKDRQLYVDAANAILVGAALIASVTFAGWLQPPLGYVPYYNLPEPRASGQFQQFAGVQQSIGVRLFWIFNCLSFSFAVATVLAGLIAVVPTPRAFYLGIAVSHLNRWLLVAAALLGLSIVFVLAAFAAAGFAVLPPFFKYRWLMLATTVVSAVPCLALLLMFVSRLLSLIPQVIEEDVEQICRWCKDKVGTLRRKILS